MNVEQKVEDARLLDNGVLSLLLDTNHNAQYNAELLLESKSVLLFWYCRWSDWGVNITTRSRLVAKLRKTGGIRLYVGAWHAQVQYNFTFWLFRKTPQGYRYK